MGKNDFAPGTYPQWAVRSPEIHVLFHKDPPMPEWLFWGLVAVLLVAEAFPS